VSVDLKGKKIVPHISFKHPVLGELTVVLSWLLNDAVSVKTAALDGRMVSECVTVGGMKIDRGNQSSERKPSPVPLSPLQIQHDLILDCTWTGTA
jgi:hypothetical protein